MTSMTPSRTGSNSSMAKTPTRPNNNYACANSPIASVKRPRSSLAEQQQRGAIMSPSKPSSSDYYSSQQHQPMSPMHPPRSVPSRDDVPEDDDATECSNADSSWVGRKVDALFSPVLSFLSAAKDEEDVAAVTDEDATMEDNQTPTITSDNSQDNDHDNDNYADLSSIETHNNLSQNNNNLSENNNNLSQNDDYSLQQTPSNGVVSSDEEPEDDAADEEKWEEEDAFNPFLFIKHLPKYHLVKDRRPPLALSRKSNRTPKTSLVLDLDETLVHCTVEPTDDADLRFPVVFHGVTYQVNVRLRPYLFDFLDKIKDKFEIIIFTASQQVYADELLNLIDPENKYFHHRLFRESCLTVEGNYLKDLNVLNRDLSRTVLVDNSPHAFGYQVDNGIPIESWFDDPNDTELIKLERFLRTLHDVEDVRTAVRYRFQVYQLVNEAGDKYDDSMVDNAMHDGAHCT